MANIGQTQYYKTTINGQDVYQAMPWAGNVPYGYNPVTQAEYTQGLQSQLDYYNNLLNSGQWKWNTLGPDSMTGQNLQTGANFTGTTPTQGNIDRLTKQLKEVQTQSGITAPGYVDPSMSQYQTNAPTISEQYYTPQYFSSLNPIQQNYLANKYPTSGYTPSAMPSNAASDPLYGLLYGTPQTPPSTPTTTTPTTPPAQTSNPSTPTTGITNTTPQAMGATPSTSITASQPQTPPTLGGSATQTMKEAAPFGMTGLAKSPSQGGGTYGAAKVATPAPFVPAVAGTGGSAPSVLTPGSTAIKPQEIKAPAAPVQQPTNGKLLKPSEFTNLQKQGLTESDITRLGADIYLKPNSRFNVGGTGAGIDSTPHNPVTAPKATIFNPTTGQRMAIYVGEHIPEGFKLETNLTTHPSSTAQDIHDFTGANVPQQGGYVPTGTEPMVPPTATPSPTTPPTPPQESYLDKYEKEVQSLSVPSKQELDIKNQMDLLAGQLGERFAQIQGDSTLAPFAEGEQARVQQITQSKLDTLARQLATVQADREARLKASTEVASIEEKKAADKAAAEKPIEVGGSLVKYNPKTGKYEAIYQAPTKSESFTLGAGEKRYDAQGNLIATGGPKTENQPASVQEYEYAKSQGYKGSFSDYQNEDANRKAKANISASGMSSAQQQAAFKLVDDYEKASGDLSKQISSYNRVVASATDPSPAGDLALIFNYMKILDPGSVVREGEFATAANSGTIGDKTYNLYNKVLSGERLSPSQRQDFVNRSKTLYQSALSQQKQVDQTFTDRANRFGVDPSLVIREQSSFSDTPTGSADVSGYISALRGQIPDKELYNLLVTQGQYTPSGNMSEDPRLILDQLTKKKLN